MNAKRVLFGGKSLVVVHSCYKPNTAPINRLLSMLHHFDDDGVSVMMVFVYPNERGDKIDDRGFNNVQVKYLWDKRRIRNKVLKYLFSFWDSWRYSRSLIPGSKVFVTGSSEYLPFFTSREQLCVYQERTEHPFVVKLRPAFVQRLYLKAVPKLNGMFVISTALKDAYVQIGARNVEIVNMTVDASRFERISKTEGKEPYVAYCGTASNNKDGVDDLIKAFAIVHGDFPKLKLYIIGKAPTKSDSSCNRELVESLDLEDSVVFTGVIPANLMPQILKDAVLLALARPDSLQARCGFPTKLGEYLLTGNPVVVTKVGDIPLFLKDGESALLAEQHNPKEFASKIIWALKNEKEAMAIGWRGKEVAMQEFDSKKESEKIVSTLFQE